MFHVFAKASSLWQFSQLPIISKLLSSLPPPPKSHTQKISEIFLIYIFLTTFHFKIGEVKPPSGLGKILKSSLYLDSGIWRNMCEIWSNMREICGKYEEICGKCEEIYGKYEGFLHIRSYHFIIHSYFFIFLWLTKILSPLPHNLPDLNNFSS